MLFKPFLKWVYAVPGSVANSLVYLGRFEETVDNTDEPAGNVAVAICTGLSFKWKISGTDPIVQADVCGACYIEDTKEDYS